MPRRWVTKISLARKAQLFFGSAVLAIIAASLIVPAYHLHNLNIDRHVRIAKEAASIALLTTDLGQPSWQAAQESLERRWPTLRRLEYGEGEFAIRPPRLIPFEEGVLRDVLGVEGFIKVAVERLVNNPQRIYEFRLARDENGQPGVRLAMAVRAGEGDQQPGALRGIIEVSVPIKLETSLINYGVLVSSLCLGALLAVLVFYLVTQRLLLSPVRKLRRLAEQVARGDVEARSTLRTGDEYEELGNAFNNMLISLNTAHEELRKTNRSLDVRLGELAETNVALFESNRVKSEFIANVSHELRTPLVSIIGFAELLVEFDQVDAKIDARLKRYANNILISGRMLLDIINDLLDLAKIEAGKLEMHLTHVSPTQICEPLIDFLTPMADKKSIHLTLLAQADLPGMHSDAGRIKQILYNLLSNALKFTPESGAVKLRVFAAGEDVITFSVSDTGPGIDEDQQARIFEKFRQIDSSVTREYGGTGLGLAITRELAHMLGGRVQLESTPGEGSTFVVTLPLQAPTEAHVPLVNLT